MEKSGRKGPTSRRSEKKSPMLLPVPPPTTAPKVDEWAATTAQASGEHRTEMTQAPSHDQIALRAYEIYLSRGASPGSDLDDWLEAERELRVH